MYVELWVCNLGIMSITVCVYVRLCGWVSVHEHMPCFINSWDVMRFDHTTTFWEPLSIFIKTSLFRRQSHLKKYNTFRIFSLNSHYSEITQWLPKYLHCPKRPFIFAYVITSISTPLTPFPLLELVKCSFSSSKLAGDLRRI